ncbi:MAG TPA: SDR family oxidoreductase [Actinomycetes bacterium]|nr:SDR family oxidoreductase [Actinomycetes bacterium]
MDLGLKGRAYLVTGGTGGLGRATAAALVADGAQVVVSSRTPERVQAAEQELGDGAVGVVADNADPATPTRLVEAARERFGRIDGLLVSVGGPPPGTVMSSSDETWRAAFESVFLGAVRLARTVVPELPEGGAIVFVLSSSVKTPIDNLAISNGLRPGLAMVAKTLAQEVAPSGVRVLGLLPGRIATDRAVQLAQANPEVAARLDAQIPLGRLGTPEEFGRVAAFLLSPAASYLTGSVIAVDGGSIPAL